MDNRLKGRMAAALTTILEGHGCQDINILAALGSFGDTLDDEEVVELLEDVASGNPPTIEWLTGATH